MINKIKNFTLPELSLMTILVIMPLIMTNGYFNVTITKMVFFSFMSVATLCVCYDKMKNKTLKMYFDKITNSDIAVALFVLFAFISVLFSKYRIEAILGNYGRFMGFIYVIAVFCAYIFITKFTLFRKQIVIAFIVSFALVCIIAVIQYMGFDIFYLLKNVKANTRVNFISTIGNINVFSSFLCLGLPIAMYLCCFHREQRERSCYFAVSLLGFYAMIISDTDSGYIGFACAFIVLGMLSAKMKNSLSRLFVLIAFFIFTIKFAVIISEIIPSPAREISKIAVYLGSSKLMVYLAFALLIAAFVLKIINVEIKHSTPMKIAFTAVPIICVIAIVCLVLWFSIADRKTNLGAFENYLRFSETWGSERGHVWRITWEAYTDMPFIKKLFGSGPDTLLLLLKQAHEQQMLQTGTMTDNAHNEYLQYLVTHGLFGLVSYLAVVLMALKKCFYNSQDDFYRRSLAVAICAYLAQAFFNISQPITTPIFLCLLFLTFSKAKDEVNTPKLSSFDEKHQKKTNNEDSEFLTNDTEVTV